MTTTKCQYILPFMLSESSWKAFCKPEVGLWNGRHQPYPSTWVYGDISCPLIQLNHPATFVKLTTGMHTQNIKSYWIGKLWVHEEMLSSYLDEFMWHESSAALQSLCHDIVIQTRWHIIITNNSPSTKYSIWFIYYFKQKIIL